MHRLLKQTFYLNFVTFNFYITTCKILDHLFLQINDELIELPYLNTVSGLKIEHSGNFVQLSRDGLIVQYDGLYSFTVTLPQFFMGKVEGLLACGLVLVNFE